MSNENLIITLMGPTASGKTQLAMELVAKYPLEIISVDSAMIYKDMDVGTGKPTAEELEKAPHHLIDFLEPTLNYSAAEFCEDVVCLIKDIHSRGKIPFLVGGTMLYFSALIKGISTLPEANDVIRSKLQKIQSEQGLQVLYEKLKQVDPQAAQKIHENDPQRILRALEVFEITGKPMTSLWQAQKTFLDDYDVKQFALFPEDRASLHEAIKLRFETMLHKGFVEEVEKLRARGDLDLSMPSMRCVGYRQIWQYLDNEFDDETMQEKALAATRQLAKRQLTWLRSWDNVYCESSSGGLKSRIKDVLSIK